MPSGNPSRLRALPIANFAAYEQAAHRRSPRNLKPMNLNRPLRYRLAPQTCCRSPDRFAMCDRQGFHRGARTKAS